MSVDVVVGDQVCPYRRCLEVDDADAEGGQLETHRLGEHGERRLRRIVDALERERHQGPDRGVVYYHGLGRVAACRRTGGGGGPKQQRQESLRDGDLRPDVQIEQLPRRVHRHVPDGHRVVARRVVDKHVQTFAVW